MKSSHGPSVPRIDTAFNTTANTMSTGSSRSVVSAVQLANHPPPQVAAVKASTVKLKEELKTMTSALDTLSRQTTPAGDLEVKKIFDGLRGQMKKQETKQDTDIKEIKKLLDAAFRGPIAEFVRTKVVEHVNRDIERIVKEQVRSELEAHIPPELQQEVVKHRRELQDLEWKLHNSESRRANAMIRDMYGHEPLKPLLMKDGSVSSTFPRSMTELFTYDDATIQKLLVDYGEERSLSATRDVNINKFLQLCGIPYQMIAIPVRRNGGQRHQ